MTADLPPRPDELLAELAKAPRSMLPALLVALAAKLAEPESPAPDGDRLLSAEQVALRLGIDPASVVRRRFTFRHRYHKDIVIPHHERITASPVRW